MEDFKMLCVRLSPVEYDKLKDFSFLQRMTISDYVRSIIHDTPIPSVKISTKKGKKNG